MKNLPVYPVIDIPDIPKASTLICYGGNWLTEWFGNKIAKFPYKPAPFHAAFYAEYGRIINVGFSTTIEKTNFLYQSTRRIDVISYKLTREQRNAAIDIAYSKAASRKYKWRLYDWRGFLYFGTKKIPVLNKILKPSQRDDFCSDMVAETFKNSAYAVSYNDDELTAPWDLVTWAENNPEHAEIHTLYTGKDFCKKYLTQK